jgi:acyl-coenzyme A thioesterase PaaI-like protein
MAKKQPGKEARSMLVAMIQRQMDSIPFMQRTGVRAVEVSRGFGRSLMPLAGNENHVGSMYMGALTTLAEAGAAVAISTVLDFERYFPVITRVDVEFLKPAMSDVTAEYRLSEQRIAELHTELEAHGRCAYTAELPLQDMNGQTVANATLTVKVLSHRRPRQPARQTSSARPSCRRGSA